MSPRVALVEVLIEENHFEPEIALGIAEAIDMAIADMQPLTLPIFDARLVAFEARLDQKLASAKADLVRWVFLVLLGNVALNAGIIAIVNAWRSSG